MGKKDLALLPFSSETDLKVMLATTYAKQINNFFGDEKKALKFLSSVISAVQRNPKLMECTGESIMNSFMVMAQLQLMPSDVGGEAYVIPYNNNKKVNGKWVKTREAQFQLGYQGLVTLFYRAGVKEVIAEIVYKNDKFSYTNGRIKHKQDVFSDDRGDAIGAYVIVKLGTGGEVSKAMNKKEIMGIAEKFSKSFKAEKKDKSPWLIENDPQLWMWRKTVLKQIAKLVPKNDAIIHAIGEDNKDSVIADRLAPALKEGESLKLGAILKKTNGESDGNTDQDQGESQEEGSQENETQQVAEGILNEPIGDDELPQ